MMNFRKSFSGFLLDHVCRLWIPTTESLIFDFKSHVRPNLFFPLSFRSNVSFVGLIFSLRDFLMEKIIMAQGLARNRHLQNFLPRTFIPPISSESVPEK